MRGNDMRKNSFFVLAVAMAIAARAGAQLNQRRASLRGDGNPNEGKCTIEVVVDGAGSNARLRMPDSPYEFQVRGIDGRGRVQLIRDPRDGPGQ